MMDPDTCDLSLVGYAERLCAERLSAYRAAPHDAEEHANVETSVLAGGYGYRQVAELVQNAADAVSEVPDTGGEARIVILIDEAGLWAANTGAPVDRSGVRALLNAHTSGKRAGQIGRFGLGFKSLLRLGGCIDVMSRTVCLRFNPDACRERIRAELGLLPDAAAPGLRLASTCAWEQGLAERQGAERFSWAATVVYAELRTNGAREAVLEELRRFPQEFLLFLPADVELELSGGSLQRRLRRRTNPGGTVAIEDLASESRATQRWRIFETHVAIDSAAALADATGVHARERVPLIWAAPASQSREAAGRFFAFFPTSTETRTLGILNAPWKLNSDRTALIPGDWNAALMDAAAELIVSNLPSIVRDDDPGVVLDAFPRELQHQNDTAAPLVQALWARLLESDALPNCDGALMRPAGLRRAPLDGPDLIRAWSRLAPPEACAVHLHPMCTATPARVSRLNQLAERLQGGAEGGPNLTRTPSREWLSLAGTEDPDGALEVLHLADAWARTARSFEWDSVRDQVLIILTSGGTLACAPDVTLQDPADPPLKAIHPALRADASALRVLRERFRIAQDAADDWQRLLESRITAAELSREWHEVWTFLRRLPPAQLTELVSWHSIRVRSLAGWTEPEHAFRPGRLIQTCDVAGLSAERSGAVRNWLLDTDYHADDDLILNALGIGDSPSWNWNWNTVHAASDSAEPGSVWLQTWLRRCRYTYWTTLSCRPSESLLGPDSFRMPVGWDLLLAADGLLRQQVTEALLNAVRSEPDRLTPVVFRHRSRPNFWKTEVFPHPLYLLLLDYGELPAAGASISMQSLLIPELVHRAQSLSSLKEWIPALEAVLQAGAGRPSCASSQEIWSEWLSLASRDSSSAQSQASLYEEAAAAGVVPDHIWSPSGPVSLSDVFIAKSSAEAESARRAAINAVALGPEAAMLWEKHGARPLSSVSDLRWVASGTAGEAVLIAELEPAMASLLRPECRDLAGLTLASPLVRRFGTTDVPLEWTEHEGRVLVSEPAFTAMPWAGRIRLLAAAAAACGWLVPNGDPELLIASSTDARRRHVASGADLAERLLRAVRDPQVLCGLFDPDIAIRLKADPARAAAVALTLLGPAVLAETSVREAMQREGLAPPERWGGEAAAQFVSALGFPPEFAASPTRRREPELLVGGPVVLKPLHPYQERVVSSLEGVLSATEDRRRRAVLSLPTGAGKTRVAAQTVVSGVLSSGCGRRRLVVWIAQTDELCEQAVQCFRELWANLGSPGEPLRIVRLWGSQINPQPPDRDEAIAVVASIQTLSSRLAAPALAWLRRPGAVVIDECHYALTPSYTALFRWFTDESGEPPFIGLSATPFRGRNEEETRQLARRFDGRLLPADQAGLFEELQKDGVLARFGYTRLEIEHRFELTSEEEHHLELFKRLPDSALERLGSDHERNRRILAELARAPERSVLLFATSVAHARRLAAHLNFMDIPAAVVSGESDRNSRRWFIEAFRLGRIRVLCNHSALTTGFDAPATDLIVIARPVFSPSLYMQMVGRGLRGPKNGGKPTCRILTVQDNLDRFSGELAHHYFEKYYVET